MAPFHLWDHKKLKMVLGRKFLDKTKSKRCDFVMQKMMSGKHYCYKGKDIYVEHVQCNMGIFETSCKWSPYPLMSNWRLDSPFLFVIVSINATWAFYGHFSNAMQVKPYPFMSNWRLDSPFLFAIVSNNTIFLTSNHFKNKQY